MIVECLVSAVDLGRIIDLVGFVQKLAGVNQAVLEERLVDQLVNLFLEAVEDRGEVVLLLAAVLGLSSLVAPLPEARLLVPGHLLLLRPLNTFLNGQMALTLFSRSSH